MRSVQNNTPSWTKLCLCIKFYQNIFYTEHNRQHRGTDSLESIQKMLLNIQSSLIKNLSKRGIRHCKLNIS